MSGGSLADERATGGIMTTAERHGIRVEHAIPGRLRLKYRPMKANPALAGHLQKTLSSIDGVTHVDTNPAIGGVTVHYHPDAAASVDFLLKVAEAFGLSAADIDPREVEEWLTFLTAGNGRDAGSALAESMESLGRLVESGIAKLSGRELNLGLLVPVALTLMGIRSLFVSDSLRTPAWYEYFWFAFGVYYTINKPESPGDAAT
ncbi:MAG TPA: hypothetical protein VFS39_00395 [Nitrospira sp.]|nr:hypothetical protein [Nitrospira sp.]